MCLASWDCCRLQEISKQMDIKQFSGLWEERLLNEMQRNKLSVSKTSSIIKAMVSKPTE